MKTYNKCEFIHYLKFTNILILYLKKNYTRGKKNLFNLFIKFKVQ